MTIRLSYRPFFLLLSLSLSLMAMMAIGGCFGAPALAQSDDVSAQARDFVDALGKEAVATMADKTLSKADRFERFRAMFHKGFDVPSIAHFVLARYWDATTPVQRQDYLQQFEELVVRSYAARFDSYTGEQFQITSSRPDGNHDVFVITEVSPANGPAITVEWRVREHEGHLGIIDVVVDGVSMSVSQRQEFESVIQAKGGDIDAFLEALRQKNASMR